ncbi:Glutathione transport system permease protein GsiD [compost metagenome]
MAQTLELPSTPSKRPFSPRALFPIACGGVILLVIALAALAPWLTPHSPTLPLPQGLDPNGLPLAPSQAHPFGTDDLGRDAFARWLYGGRVSLAVGFSATALAGFIGISLGVLAGYRGGWVDMVLMRLTEVVMAFPTLLLAMGLAAVLPPHPAMVVLTLGLVGWTAIARLVRGMTLSLRETEFIDAARAMGGSTLWILLRHLLPNLSGAIASLLALKLADMFLLEAALSFLGLGVRPPTPSWGNMIHDGQLYFRDAPWLFMAPGLAIFAVVLAFNLLGDRWGRR